MGKLWSTEHGVSPKGNVTCPNQRQSASQNYDAHTRTHTHTGTRPLRRSGVLQHTEILSAAKWPTLGYLSTHPVIQFVPAFVHSLGQRPNPHTHTHSHTLTHTHTRPGAAINRRQPSSPAAVPRNQLTGNFNYFTGCVRHAKWPEPNVNTISLYWLYQATSSFSPPARCHSPTHEITKSSDVEQQGCRNMSHEWTKGNGADHCDW